MADINDCTPRTLSLKAGISVNLANQIVDFRKERGRINFFSELCDIEGMTIPAMKGITSAFAIGKDTGTELSSNNIPGSSRKIQSSSKPNCSKKCSLRTPKRKQNQTEITNRFMESLPLLTNDGCDANYLAVYTPKAVHSSPSGENIVAFYQMTSPDRRQSTVSRNNCATDMSTRTNPPSVNRYSVTSRGSRYARELSPTEERSIWKWLQGTLATKRSKSKSRGRNPSKSPPGNSAMSPLLHQYSSDDSVQNSPDKGKKKDTAKPYLNINGKDEKSELKLLQNKLHRMTKADTKTKEQQDGHTLQAGRKIATDEQLTLENLDTSTDGKNRTRTDDRENAERKAQSRSTSAESVGVSISRSPEAHDFRKDKHDYSMINTSTSHASENNTPHMQRLTRRSLWNDSEARQHTAHMARSGGSSSYHRHRRYNKSRDRRTSRDNRHRQYNRRSNDSCLIL